LTTVGQYHPQPSCFWVSGTFDKWDRFLRLTRVDFAVKPSDAFNVDELLSLIAFEPLLRPLSMELQVSQSPIWLFASPSDLV